jgi:hypothetical protein
MPPLLLPPISLGIGSEIIYSFVIIICSLMIYFGTKEIYDLSSYKGIKYFRQAFLFFGIAYLCRFFIEFIVISFNLHGILDIYPLMLGYVALFVFMYLSSISIFYLIYSVSWKKWKDKSKMVYIFHIIAILIALASIFFNNQIFYIGLNILLLISAVILISVAWYNQRNKLKKNNLFFIYFLLFIFFILNVFNILVPIFLESLKLLIYLISLGIFLVILYKVLKKSGD